MLDMVTPFILHQQTHDIPRLIAYSEDNPAVKRGADGMMMVRQRIFSKRSIARFMIGVVVMIGWLLPLYFITRFTLYLV